MFATTFCHLVSIIVSLVVVHALHTFLGGRDVPYNHPSRPDLPKLPLYIVCDILRGLHGTYPSLAFKDAGLIDARMKCPLVSGGDCSVALDVPCTIAKATP